MKKLLIVALCFVLLCSCASPEIVDKEQETQSASSEENTGYAGQISEALGGEEVCYLVSVEDGESGKKVEVLAWHSQIDSVADFIITATETCNETIGPDNIERIRIAVSDDKRWPIYAFSNIFAEYGALSVSGSDGGFFEFDSPDELRAFFAPEPTPTPTPTPAPASITEADIIDGIELYIDTLEQSGATGTYELHADSGIITTVITISSATLETATPESLDEFADIAFTSMNVCVLAANAGEELPIEESDLDNGYYGGLFDLYDGTIAIVDEAGEIYADFMLLRTTHDVMAFYGDMVTAETSAPEATPDPDTPADSASSNATANVDPEPEATPEPEPEATPTPEPEPTPEAESSGGMVYIPKSGSKYHESPDCSNMKNPSEVSESTAISRGYEKCSKCW